MTCLVLKEGIPHLGPLWDPFGPSQTIWDTMDHASRMQGAICVPFQTCSNSLKPSNSGYSVPEIMESQMDDPRIHRSIDRSEGQTLQFRPFWGLNLESIGTLRMLYLVHIPSGTVVTCGSAVMHLYWAIPIPDALRGGTCLLGPIWTPFGGPEWVPFGVSK